MANLILLTGEDWDKLLNSLDELIQVNAPEELWKSCLRVIKQSELLRISPNRASLDKLKTLD